MPELPDLEIFRENLGRELIGRRVVSADVHDIKRVSSTSEGLEAMLSGASPSCIAREGKELFFSFSNGALFSVHLMLKGRFSLHPAGDFPKGLRGKLLSLGFEDGREMTISDEMRLCKILFTPKRHRAPDVFSEKFTLPYFLKRAQASAMINVKTFLLTQSNMRGIGNAYADEILYVSGVSPASLTGRIPQDKLREMYGAILFVLRDAVEQIRALSPDIIAGEERSFLRVHNKEKTLTEKGEPILIEEIASNTTYYTASQKLY